MDFNKLIARAKAILLGPNTEWPVIAGEAATVKGLYSGYFIWLAAIPAICDFIHGSILGYSAFGVTVRTGIVTGIGKMITMYVLSLVMLYVVALIINALAPTFQGQKNQVQALKAIGYAYTAVWIAGFGHLIPWLGTLILIAGGVYSIYLLYLGLPHTMQCPQDKAAGYTVVTVLISLVLGWIMMLLVGGMFMTAHVAGSSITSSDGSSITVDKDSPLGKLDALSKRLDSASKQMEQAQKSGDSEAAGQAMGAMMGALAGSNGPVEALAPDQLKAFLPDSIDGLKRSSISAERNKAMGMQTSQAEADYASEDGSRHLTIKLTDTGGAKGLLSMASAFGVERDQETAEGFDKTWHEDGRMLHAQWDKASGSGEYSVVLGQRFSAEARGNGDSIDGLKEALAEIDLDQLESLKDHGVKQD
ncbi:MAG TPA: Yip1 family protein [Rhodanobacteraceae bacterium]|nr:Yip1 family protein [Rhodanobacteraceae bacterium]